MRIRRTAQKSRQFSRRQLQALLNTCGEPCLQSEHVALVLHGLHGPTSTAVSVLCVRRRVGSAKRCRFCSSVKGSGAADLGRADELDADEPANARREEPANVDKEALVGVPSSSEHMSKTRSSRLNFLRT